LFRLAGPGFINIKVDREWLGAHVQGILVNGASSIVSKLSQRVVVDFSSPNVAKEMHVGHLRSTILGDTICKILEFCGADVVRLNHIGDWGTQFGMLIQFMREREGGLGGDEAVSDLMALYKYSLATSLLPWLFHHSFRVDRVARWKRRVEMKHLVTLAAGPPHCCGLQNI
jgi:arginyl-tRNA synthetase